MTAHISPDDIHTLDDEPRILDLKLATALGFERPRKIRELIDRNLSELETYGEVCAMVAQTGEETDFTDDVILPHGGAKSPRGRGRPGREYHLTEAQALLVCMFARTNNAAEVRAELIRVFMEWRARTLPRHGAPPFAIDDDDDPYPGRTRATADRPYGYDIPPPTPFRLIDGRELARHDIDASLGIMREFRRAVNNPALLELWRLLGLPVPDLPPPVVAPGARHEGLECLLHLLGSECGEGNPLVQAVITAAHVDDEDAIDILNKHGMKVLPEGVVISNTHPFILAVFHRTRWKRGGHMGALRSLPTVYVPRRTFRFAGNGRSARGTVVPMRLIEEPVLADA